MIDFARALGVLLLLASVADAAAQETGRIAGSVAKDGKGVGGVIVLINELKVTEVTEENGDFRFENVPPGTYNLIFTLGNNNQTRTIIVIAGQTMKVDLEVDWDVGVTEKVKVTAAARAAKIVDAPAAVTAIPEEQVEQQAATGQVPKVLEFTPGAEVTQSGLYDFNFNTRGFNSSLNRRVSTYIDGRDVGVVLLGAQEWAAIAGGLNDVANLEFIRGPSAALYGANASSGVVNITTKAPRNSLGSLVRLTAGELDTRSIDFRRADSLGKGWYSKVLLGFKRSGDFSISRNPDPLFPAVDDAPEYSEYCIQTGDTDCLLREKPLFISQDNEIQYGLLRFDKFFTDTLVMTVEGGLSDISGPVFQTGIGRVQNLDSTRPFYRLNFAAPHWNVQAHYSAREGDQANLNEDLIVNYELITDTERYGIEGQGNWTVANEKVRFVVGAAHTEERVDTTNPETGLQTVVYEPIAVNRQALFAQLDWIASPHLKLVFAGRVDDSTLHPRQFSPKAAMVYSFNAKHSIRLTYNQAFQVANYSEFFLSTRLAPFPIGGFVRTICEAPILQQPVDCGIEENFIPILAVGNNDLSLETTEAVEIGYSGLIGRKVFITVDYYNSRNNDFITDLIPQVGTPLGVVPCIGNDLQPSDDATECPVNPDYLPWVSTPEAESTILFGTLTVAQALRNAVENSVGGSTLGFRLAQNLDGSTVVVGRTYTNIGQVNTQGVDFGLQYFVTPDFHLQFSYSWFDFEIVDYGENAADFDQEDFADVSSILLPNTPAHKASVAATYGKGRWALSAGARWVEGFRWSAGLFQGDVPSYATGDLAASYAFNKNVRLGLNVANVTDRVHHQTFGGDLLRRRALLNLTFTW